MKDFEIRCDESRLEKNNALYGKFSLGPFLPGQGTTFGNALRRSLLSELSGLGITAFEIIGVMQEFSTLPGLRESVLDLSLNLKQIVLTGVLPFSTPPIGFLKVRGPAIIYAADLKLPAGVYCAVPKQYIGTLASNGVLNLKFLVSVGKGHSTQPYSLYRSLSKVKLQPWEKESTFFSNSDYTGARPVQNISSDAQSSLYSRIAIGETELESINKKTINSVASPMNPTAMRELELKRQKVFNAEILNQTSQAGSVNYEKKGPQVNSMHMHNSPQVYVQTNELNGEGELNQKIALNNSNSIHSDASLPLPRRGKGSKTSESNHSGFNSKKRCTNTAGVSARSELEVELHPFNQNEIGLETNGGIKYVNIQKQTFQRVNPHQVLPIDAVFTPVSQVNFLTQVNDRFETPRENVVLEIWTNGSIHPKRALEEAALSLVQNFDTLLKNIQQASSFHKGLRYSNSFQSFNGSDPMQNQQRTMHQSEDFGSAHDASSMQPPVTSLHLVHLPEGVKGQRGKANKSDSNSEVNVQWNELEQNNALPKHKENSIKKTPSIIGKLNLDNVPLNQAIYNLDIGNLDLSLETFILLKQAKIKNLAHLLKNLYSKEGKFFVKVEESSLQHNIIYTNLNSNSLDELNPTHIHNVPPVNVQRGKRSEASDPLVLDPNVCLNDKIIEELSNLFRQLGINLYL